MSGNEDQQDDAQVPPEFATNEVGQAIYRAAKALGWPVDRISRFDIDAAGRPYMLVDIRGKGFVELVNVGRRDMFWVRCYIAAMIGRSYSTRELPDQVKVPDLPYAEFIRLVDQYKLDES